MYVYTTLYPSHPTYTPYTFHIRSIYSKLTKNRSQASSTPSEPASWASSTPSAPWSWPSSAASCPSAGWSSPVSPVATAAGVEDEGWRLRGGRGYNLSYPYPWLTMTSHAGEDAFIIHDLWVMIDTLLLVAGCVICVCFSVSSFVCRVIPFAFACTMLQLV